MFETMYRSGPAKSLTTAWDSRGMIVAAGDDRPLGVALKHGAVVRILVIEDNLSDVFLLERALKGQELRYELVHLLTGGDALAFFRGQGVYANAPVPDLILVDLNLSKYTGEDILCEIQRSPHLAGVPVCVWSSSQSPRDEGILRNFGVARFITKPTGLNQFMEIGRIIKDMLAGARPA
jgi:chemotaxis family two-component system response regulator Rcp1